MSNKGIKYWSESDRPREKMIQHGISALSDVELIAIIFSSGSRDKSAVDLARELLLYAKNDLNQLAKLSLKDIQKLKGIGPAKAISLAAALELGRRRKHDTDLNVKKIVNSSHAASVLFPLMQDLNHEVFAVLYLARSNKVLHKEIVSQGGVSATVVDIKIIMKKALEHLASTIIIAHNHPSGNTKPSQQDIKITKKIQEAGRFLDINIADHLIIAGDQYYSFADEGML